MRGLCSQQEVRNGVGMIGVRGPLATPGHPPLLIGTDTWGLADIEAAIAAIPLWMDTVAWDGPAADLNRWYVSGHSNGGMVLLYPLPDSPK